MIQCRVQGFGGESKTDQTLWAESGFMAGTEGGDYDYKSRSRYFGVMSIFYILIFGGYNYMHFLRPMELYTVSTGLNILTKVT